MEPAAQAQASPSGRCRGQRGEPFHRQPRPGRTRHGVALRGGRSTSGKSPRNSATAATPSPPACAAGETRTLGVLVPRLSDTVMALMFEEIERAAAARGYFAMVATSGDDPDDERRAAETLLDRNVDGLILATARLDDELPRLLRQRGVAHALVLRTDGVSPSAIGDDEVGGYLAVRHLIDLGHRDIAVVTGPSFTSTGVGTPGRRPQGPGRSRHHAAGKSGCIAAGYGIENGYTAGETLLGGTTGNAPQPSLPPTTTSPWVSSQRPTASASLSGEDLALVGYNDIPLSATAPHPPVLGPRPPGPDRRPPPSTSSSTQARNPTSASPCQHSSRANPAEHPCTLPARPTCK